MQHNEVFGSFIFKFIERFAVKGIGLVIGVILARLISPNDFGQIAILSVFINLSQTIIQSGFSTALVQNKDVDDDDYSTVFYINVVASLVIILILFFIAPIISAYYATSALVVPLRVYSLSLVFGAINSVQNAKLQREMRFKEAMVCSLLATLGSGFLGVIMAYLGFGLWALIGYYFSNVVFSSIVMAFTTKWYPRLVFSTNRAKELYGYGWKLLVSGVLCSLHSDIQSLVIGKKFSTSTLGYYNRGQQIPQILAMTMDSSVQSVMLPVLSQVQDQKSRFRDLVKRSVSLDMLFIAPAMVGLALVAESIVIVLYTEAWLPSAIYVQLVCLAYLSAPFISSHLIAIKAIGRSDVYMKLEIVRRIMMLVVLAISILCFDSVLAIAIGFVVSSFLDVVIVSVPILKLIDYSLWEQIKDLWKILVAVMAMAIVVWTIDLFALHAVLKLLAQVFVGVVSYVGLCFALKVESFRYCVDKLTKLTKK